MSCKKLKLWVAVGFLTIIFENPAKILTLCRCLFLDHYYLQFEFWVADGYSTIIFPAKPTALEILSRQISIFGSPTATRHFYPPIKLPNVEKILGCGRRCIFVLRCSLILGGRLPVKKLRAKNSNFGSSTAT